MLRRFSVVAVGLVSCILNTAQSAIQAAEGAGRGPLPLDLAAGAPHLCDQDTAHFSPDGGLLAIAVCDRKRFTGDHAVGAASYAVTGTYWGGFGADIWIVNLKTGRSDRITGEIGNNFAPAWSHDGRSLAFYSDRDGATRLWVWDRQSSAIRRINEATTLSWARQTAVWSADDSRIYTKVLPPGAALSDWFRLMAPSAPARQESEAAVEILDESLSSAVSHLPDPDARHMNGWFGSLASISVASGDLQFVKKSPGLLIWFATSPSGRYAAFAEDVGTGPEHGNLALSLYDERTQESWVIATPTQRALGGNLWSPDGRVLAFLSASPSPTINVYDPAQKTAAEVKIRDETCVWPRLDWVDASKQIAVVCPTTISVINVATGESRAIAKSTQGPLRIFSRRGERLSNDTSLYLAQFDAHAKSEEVSRLDLSTGNRHTLFRSDESIDSYGTSPDGKMVLLSSQSASQPDALYSLNTVSGAVKKIFDPAPELSRYSYGRSEAHSWTDEHGVSRAGLLVFPVGYVKGRRYPTIVDIYPGVDVDSNFGNDKSDVFISSQVFATRGYAVYMPYIEPSFGSPMNSIGMQVSAVAKFLVAENIAQPKGLGLIGHSFGGYSVMSTLVSFPDYQAAVAFEGVSNLMSYYGQMQMGAVGTPRAWGETENGGQFMIGTTPWQNRDGYINNSPIFFADRISTPLLLIHGEKDDNVSATQSDEMYLALRRLGKPVEYIRYRKGSHNPLYDDYPTLLDYTTRVVSWFDAHLSKANVPSLTTSRGPAASSEDSAPTAKTEWLSKK